MYWYWIHVYNYDRVIGSTYSDTSNKEEVTKQLNKEFGEGKWTKYTIE